MRVGRPHRGGAGTRGVQQEGEEGREGGRITTHVYICTKRQSSNKQATSKRNETPKRTKTQNEVAAHQHEHAQFYFRNRQWAGGRDPSCCLACPPALYAILPPHKLIPAPPPCSSQPQVFVVVAFLPPNSASGATASFLDLPPPPALLDRPARPAHTTDTIAATARAAAARHRRQRHEDYRPLKLGPCGVFNAVSMPPLTTPPLLPRPARRDLPSCAFLPAPSSAAAAIHKTLHARCPRRARNPNCYP